VAEYVVLCASLDYCDLLTGNEREDQEVEEEEELQIAEEEEMEYDEKVGDLQALIHSVSNSGLL